MDHHLVVWLLAFTVQYLLQHTTFWWWLLGTKYDVSVVIAAGVRPVPFRTRKLSLFALMVLHL